MTLAAPPTGALPLATHAMSYVRRLVPTALATLLGVACGRERASAPALGALEEIPVSAAPGSTWPSLATDSDGRLVLGWLEPVDSATHRLRFARREGSAWTAPSTIVERADLMVNWADFPAVVPLPANGLAAWWPQKSALPGDNFAYDAMAVTSRDGGATWSAPIALHSDRTRTEHGFVSFVPVGARGDSIGAVWLDGRDYARTVAEPAEHRMQLAAATLGDGAAPAEHMLDTMVCSCCRTSSTRTRRAVLVAYRDRDAGEVRDIAVARYEGGRWQPSVKVHADGWVYPGCPVNGAVLGAHGDTVAVAWFTAPDQQARVNVAFSTDGGRTFGAPTRVDDGSPSGRAAVVVDASGAATVTWIERVSPTRSRLPWMDAEKQAKGTPVGGAELRARRVRLDGTRGESQSLLASTEARASGFPQLAAIGDTVYLAWTEPGAGDAPSRLRVARSVFRNPPSR